MKRLLGFVQTCLYYFNGFNNIILIGSAIMSVVWLIISLIHPTPGALSELKWNLGFLVVSCGFWCMLVLLKWRVAMVEQKEHANEY